MAMSLRPASLDHLGLTAALIQYVQAISEKHDLKVQFETVGIYERLPQEMETTIYRIIQEAVSNAIRHAHATRIDVLLEKRDGKVLALIEDNGTGFNREEAFTSGRMGLFGMRERAEMLGGRLVIESSPGSGTTIQAEIPYLTDNEVETDMVLAGGEL
ncbi:MAG: sensor histidine kinase [Chloroflexi bacterium]|nr:MAG: sensor histidine kinase [Chloroflexota bacterium]